MTETIQVDSLGKDNRAISFEPATVTNGETIEPLVLKVNLSIANTAFDSSAFFMSLLTHGSTANIISQLATSVSGEMLQLAMSSNSKSPIAISAKLHKMHTFLSKITEISALLTSTVTTMSHQMHSQLSTSNHFSPNPTVTPSASSPSVSSSASFPCNAVNCGRRFTKLSDLEVHQESRIVMTPTIEKENVESLALVDDKENENASKVEQQDKQSPTPHAVAVDPEAV